MLSALKWITALIFVAIIASTAYKINTFRLIETSQYLSNVSQLISLQGVDEYVIAELQTNEDFHKGLTKRVKIPGLFSISAAKLGADVSAVATYKYYVKLSEVKYGIEGDTLVLNVPALYLSVPVAFDSATLKTSCSSTSMFVKCKPLVNDLISDITGVLETKGKLNLSNVFEKAAKALADNFDSFAKNNEKDVFYKNIAVVFTNESATSRRLFNYNKSFCGNEPCKLELPLSDGRFLTIK